MKQLIFVAAVTVLSTGWTIRELPTLPGGGLCAAHAVNNNSEAVGQAQSAGGVMRAVHWNKVGGIREIPTPVIPGRFSVAYDINEMGWVVGRMGTSTSTAHAFKWRMDTAVVDLGPSASESIANSISDANHIAGQWTVAGSPARRYAVVWPFGTAGSPYFLGNFGGYVDYAMDVAPNAPVVTGAAMKTSGQQRAFLYIDGSGPIRDLGTLGGNNSRGRSVMVGTWPDPTGDTVYVVGESELVPGSFNTNAFLYHGGTMTDIGGLPGCTQNIAYAINRSKDIVGTSWCSGYSRAFLYQGGVMIDLITLIGTGTGWEQLQVAYDINEAGVIVGYGIRYGQMRGFLMKP